MKIFSAQVNPKPGCIEDNISKHVELVEAAASHSADLVFFPELSITGYEPELADSLASTVEDSRFDIIQSASDRHEITIAIGMPLKSEGGNTISLIFFQPKKHRVAYSKQILHADEVPYFVSGSEQVLLQLKDETLAPAICFESLQSSHSINAKNKGATVYLASVAKHEAGVAKAYNHYSELAKQSRMVVLMANCYGLCDNFLSYGSSAVWATNGNRIAQLDNTGDGLVGIDTISGETIVVKKNVSPNK